MDPELLTCLRVLSSKRVEIRNSQVLFKTEQKESFVDILSSENEIEFYDTWLSENEKKVKLRIRIYVKKYHSNFYDKNLEFFYNFGKIIPLLFDFYKNCFCFQINIKTRIFGDYLSKNDLLKNLFKNHSNKSRNKFMTSLLSKNSNNLELIEKFLKIQDYEINYFSVCLKQVIKDNLEGLSKIIEAGKIIRNSQFSTLFHFSIKNNFIDIVDFLISKMTDRAEIFEDIINEILFFDRDDILLKLLKEEVYKNYLRCQNSFLVLCGIRNSYKCCNLLMPLLISSEKNCNFVKNNVTPLLASIRTESLQTFDILVEYCDINFTTLEGNNALCESIKIMSGLPHHNYYFEKLISKNNIDVNISNGTGFNPLIVAIKENKFEVFKRLVTHPNIIINCGSGRNNNPLFKIIALKRVEMMKFLIGFKTFKTDFKSLKTLKSSGGNTIYHYGVNHDDYFLFLYDNNIDYTVKNNRGYNVLELAIRAENDFIFYKIVNECKDINIFGKNIMIEAVEVGREDYFDLILSKGLIYP